MSLTQLRYFVAVAEERNFHRAAKRLAVSQPPLSRQIRALEDELGADLLRRTPRGAELTPSGTVMLERARDILASVEGAASAARAAAAGALAPSGGEAAEAPPPISAGRSSPRGAPTRRSPRR